MIDGTTEMSFSIHQDTRSRLWFKLSSESVIAIVEGIGWADLVNPVPRNRGEILRYWFITLVHSKSAAHLLEI